MQKTEQMTIVKKEQYLLDAAITAVNRTANIKLKATTGAKIENKQIDAEITIEGYKKIHFAAEVKPWVQQANFGALVNQVKQLPGKGILVADYVNPTMADKLRDLDIPYIDAVGNAYINEKPIYILVKMTKGQANEIDNLKGLMNTQTRGRAFNPAGLKVVYLFLTDGKMLNAPYREIAYKADVALGAIGEVIKDLKQGGYLIDIKDKARRLTRKEKLLEKWVDAYLEKLRPKLEVGTFKAENPMWWRRVKNDITNYGAKFGGEVATHEIAGYITPQEITIYLEDGDGADLFKEYKFKKDPKGDIHVYRAFWSGERNTPKIDETDFVNPLITYADLIGTGDIRNLEAAEELLGDEFAGLILEN